MSLSHEQSVRITARLYQMSDTARNLWGPRYEERMVPYRAVLWAKAADDGTDPVATGVYLVNQALGDDAPFAAIGFAAATVEAERGPA